MSLENIKVQGEINTGYLLVSTWLRKCRRNRC